MKNRREKYGSLFGEPAGRSVGSMIVTKVNERESIPGRQIEIEKKTNNVQLDEIIS